MIYSWCCGLLHSLVGIEAECIVTVYHRIIFIECLFAASEKLKKLPAPVVEHREMLILCSSVVDQPLDESQGPGHWTNLSLDLPFTSQLILASNSTAL